MCSQERKGEEFLVIASKIELNEGQGKVRMLSILSIL